MPTCQDHFEVELELPSSAEPIRRAFIASTLPHRARPSLQLECVRKLQYHKLLEDLSEADRLTTLLFLQVVEDLTEVGWTFQYSPPNCLKVFPLTTTPDPKSGKTSSLQEVKQNIRQMLVKRRNEQLRSQSVRKFLHRLERPREYRGVQVSILDLFTDGKSLAQDIRRRLNAPEEVSEQLLLDAVDPYLQKVTDDRDPFTGLKLQEIWRYCRYTWSLPYSSQPGRRINYLIRDRARSRDPIMGIGAIGSSPVQITPRDNAIGWTVFKLRDLCRHGDEDQAALRFQALERTLHSAIENLYTEDLVDLGLLFKRRKQVPNDLSLERLQSFLDEGPSTSRMEGPPEKALPEEAVTTPFYRRKRVRTLYGLLSALRIFEMGRAATGSTMDCLRWMLDRKEGEQALKRAIRALKKRQVGTSIMSITTCGAIPPYNPILGGKLTSLLMASPQVISDYKGRYEGRASHIASRMKGEELVRDNSLVLLTTTSLYHVGSSQYNRLKTPTQNGELRFHELDEKTRGFGSVHLSKRTYDTLQKLQEVHSDLKEHSHRFGSGANYKMRSISSGLAHIGLEKLLNHRNPRIVYLIPLANNWKEYLSGVDETPDLIYRNASETQELIDFWKRRWFSMRARKPEIVRRVENSPPVRVSDLPYLRLNPAPPSTQHFEERASSQSDTSLPKIQTRSPRKSSFRFSGPAESDVRGRTHGRLSSDNTSTHLTSTRLTTPAAYMSSKSLSWSTFAELHEGRASFAERLSDEELELIHVETGLDKNLIPLLEEGRRVYLTGNPGDGKTHIIEKYRQELDELGVFVELDASATSESVLAARIREAIEEKRPALIAVNEGPLRQMLPALPQSERKVLRSQLNTPFVYSGDATRPENPILANLGLRQVLTDEVISGMLKVTLENVDYSNAPDIVQKNVNRLKHIRVQNRIRSLLKRVAQSGSHIPVHRVLGFFAFIVTGGYKSFGWAQRNCQSYHQLAFDPDCPLHEHLQDLDPVSLTHPSIDADIWDGRSQKHTQWIEAPAGDAPVDVAASEAMERFHSLKRRYFFEATDGDRILEMVPTDQSSFFSLLEGKATESAKIQILRSISEFFGGSTSESLPVWTGLRYDAAGPPTAFVAAHKIPDRNFEILKPRLPRAAGRLVEYVADHVRIQLRENGADADSYPGLNVDLDLWLELRKIREGLPPEYRDEIVERRLTRFLSQVASRVEDEDEGYVRLQIRDLDAIDTYAVDVSLEEGIYRLN